MQRRELGIYLNYITNPSVELTRFSGARQSPNSLQILIPCVGPQKFSKPLKMMCAPSVSLLWPVGVLRSLQWQKPRLWLLRANPLLQSGYCNGNSAPSTWNWSWLFPKPTGNTEVRSQTSCERTVRERLHHLALKFRLQILTIPFLTAAWHSQEEMLKTGRFTLVMETIPSLNRVCESTPSCRAPGTKNKHCKRFQSGKGGQDWCTEHQLELFVKWKEE